MGDDRPGDHHRHAEAVLVLCDERMREPADRFALRALLICGNPMHPATQRMAHRHAARFACPGSSGRRSRECYVSYSAISMQHARPSFYSGENCLVAGSARDRGMGAGSLRCSGSSLPLRCAFVGPPSSPAWGVVFGDRSVNKGEKAASAPPLFHKGEQGAPEDTRIPSSEAEALLSAEGLSPASLVGSAGGNGVLRSDLACGIQNNCGEAGQTNLEPTGGWGCVFWTAAFSSGGERGAIAAAALAR